MNVRLTPRAWPNRTDLYGGIVRVSSDGANLRLSSPLPWLLERGLAHGHYREGRLTPPLHVLTDTVVPLKHIAEIQIDDEPGDCW